jgi:hypothetical protein
MDLSVFSTFVGITFLSLLFAQVVAATKDFMLTAKQAFKKGLKHFLPFLWHLGMWGDLVLLPPWFMYVCERFASQWKPWQLIVSMTAGLLVSAGLHVLYAQAKTPEAHAHDGKLTVAGWLHFVYMGLGTGFAFQFYCFTKSTPAFVILTSLMFGIHMTLATHIVPALWCKMKRLDWYPHRPWRDKVAIIFVLGLWTALTAATLMKM